MSYIISTDCMDCGVCEFMCPQDAIFEAKRQFVIRKDRCNDCGECVPYCPARAIVHRDDFTARQERSVRAVLGGALSGTGRTPAAPDGGREPAIQPFEPRVLPR